jgi:hypothetical protein
VDATSLDHVGDEPRTLWECEKERRNGLSGLSPKDHFSHHAIVVIPTEGREDLAKDYVFHDVLLTKEKNSKSPKHLHVGKYK